jgi:O-antigen/teichoic acid export membrane protein
MASMDARSLFFRGNRLWWFGGLFVGPIVGRLFGDPAIGVFATGLLILPIFVLFDTDRPWWPDEVRRLPLDHDGTRSELRKLTLWAAIGLMLGLLVALR